MEYAVAGVPQQDPASVPELGHLKAAADRLGQLNYNLGAFHNRFFGPQPPSGGDTAKQIEPQPCYRNDIAAVFEQISLLETLVSDLNRIG